MGQSTASGTVSRPAASSSPFSVSLTVPSPPTATMRRAPSASAPRASSVAWPGALVKRGSKAPSRAVSSARICTQRLAAPPLFAAGLMMTAKAWFSFIIQY